MRKLRRYLIALPFLAFCLGILCMVLGVLVALKYIFGGTDSQGFLAVFLLIGGFGTVNYYKPQS